MKAIAPTLLNKFAKYFFISIILLATFSAANAYDLVVAQDGSGNYTTVQAAINAAPNNGTTVFTIFIKNGKYREKVNVAASKTFVQLIGESVANTIVYYDDPATVLGTQNSASFTISANDFSAINITFANTFGDGSQAVAVLVSADRVAFKNCRFMGNQDTIYTKGGTTARHYFYKCYIDGNVDFIFGSSTDLFDSCYIYAKSRSAAGASYITAANTLSGQTYGYVFNNCILPSNTGNTLYYLGRPWNNATGNTSAFNKTVYINPKYGGNQIQPLGWTAWDAGTITSQITYAEYLPKNMNGTAANTSSRVAWSQQLADATLYSYANVLAGWDPCTVYTGFCSNDPRNIAVSNFRGVKGATSSQFDWNISWPITGVDYKLYRSSDNINFTPIFDTLATNDTAVNFKFIDASLPIAGQKYYYYVQASLGGYATQITDTFIISSKQTITSSNTSISAFAQQLNTPSDSKAFSISAVNLTSNLLITPPANFEISVDGTTWYSSISPLTISPTAGSIANTTILVRLNASALGSYSGNILLTADNATDVNVAVSGSTVLIVEKPIALIQWPLTANYNNLDSAAARSTYLFANTSRLNNMVVSDGVTLPTLPAYSNLYGQAFNSGLLGTGLWTVTGNGGNGGVLNRSYYEEFVIKPTSTKNVRIDSFVCYFNYYGAAGSATNFGYRLGCVWSKTGFTNTNSAVDSVDAISCDSSGVTGVSSTSTHKGGFTDYLLINTKSDGTGPITRLAFTLANGGVSVGNNPLLRTNNTSTTLATGDSLIVRLYFSGGSGSNKRYATLKNVIAKGIELSTAPVKLIDFSGGVSNNHASLWWTTSCETTVKKYFIQSSTNGNEFKDIGVIQSNANCSANKYNFVDDRTLQGNVFYRLRIVDINGNETISSVFKLGAISKIFTINVYPNPADKEVVVNYPKVVSEAFISVKDANGKILIKQLLQASTVATTLNLTQLTKGVYFVSYFSNGEAITKKIIKR